MDRIEDEEQRSASKWKEQHDRAAASLKKAQDHLVGSIGTGILVAIFLTSAIVGLYLRTQDLKAEIIWRQKRIDDLIVLQDVAIGIQKTTELARSGNLRTVVDAKTGETVVVVYNDDGVPVSKIGATARIDGMTWKEWVLRPESLCAARGGH